MPAFLVFRQCLFEYNNDGKQNNFILLETFKKKFKKHIFISFEYNGYKHSTISFLPNVNPNTNGTRFPIHVKLHKIILTQLTIFKRCKLYLNLVIVYICSENFK